MDSKGAVEKIRQLRKTADFNHAAHSHSVIDFSRSAFAGHIERVPGNGRPNRWYRNDVTLSLRQEEGWREGLNEMTVYAGRAELRAQRFGSARFRKSVETWV